STHHSFTLSLHDALPIFLLNAGLARISAAGCPSSIGLVGRDRRTATPVWPSAGSVGTARTLARTPSTESIGPATAAMQHNRGERSEEHTPELQPLTKLLS